MNSTMTCAMTGQPLRDPSIESMMIAAVAQAAGSE